MDKPRSNIPLKNAENPSPLLVRPDEDEVAVLGRAAALRKISVNDYVLTVAVAQARLETLTAEGQPLALTREGQLAFWHALDRPVKLTAGQERLGRMMRGEE